METLEELVKKRKGYKYLKKDRYSPYQNYKYNLKNKKEMVCLDLNTDVSEDCGAGWNLATLKWIANNCLKLDGMILECTIPDEAKIDVPKNSDGKFRTNIIKIKKVHKIHELFPILKDFETRFKKYKTINPITAVKMPPVEKIKDILNQVGNKVWDQVRDQVGNQVWDQVGNKVWDQVRICSYMAIVDFLNLNYKHPTFDLIRLGIVVVNISGVFKVFGKNGKFLGEFDE
jgi:hypothetical protein